MRLSLLLLSMISRVIFSHTEITPSEIITHHDKIPRFCSNPTHTAVSSGNWMSPSTWSNGSIPGSEARVSIPAGKTVTFDSNTATPLDCVEIEGFLKFSFTQNTRMTLSHLMVLPQGTLQIGSAGGPISPQVKAQVIFRDTPVQTGTASSPGRDPSQYGTGLISLGNLTIHGSRISRTWLRLKKEASANSNTLELESTVADWKVGQRIIIPDTRQTVTGEDWLHAKNQLQYQNEEAIIQAVNNNVITLTQPLKFDHLGRSYQGTTGNYQFLAHVGLLDRNVIFQSENPMGTRGHILISGEGNVDIQYAQFKDLGRTDAFSPLHSTEFNTDGTLKKIGTNQIGRYSLHIHHLLGVAPLPNQNKFQFKLVGNSVQGGKKWAIALHNSHWGQVSQNVIYDHQGAGLVTEDGSEINNRIVNNFAVKILGTNVDGRDGLSVGEGGRGGVGFWFRRTGNLILGNVAASCSFAGFLISSYYLTEVKIPLFQGFDKDLPGKGQVVRHNPAGAFSQNESYGTSAFGFWSTMPTGSTEISSPHLLISHLRLWNSGFRAAVIAWYTTHNTYDRLVVLSDPSKQNHPGGGTVGMHMTTYGNGNLAVQNSVIAGTRIGIWAPRNGINQFGTEYPTRIQSSELSNHTNILISPAVDGYGGIDQSTEIRNVSFSFQKQTITQSPSKHILMGHANSLSDYISKVIVKVFNFNHSGEDFQVFFKEQAPERPSTSSDLSYAISRPTILNQFHDPFGVGLPEAITNEENQSKYGFSLSGDLSPCATERADITGFTCPIEVADQRFPFVQFVTPWQGAISQKDGLIVVRTWTGGRIPAGSRVLVTLNGLTTQSAEGRNFLFYGVPEGAHKLEAKLVDSQGMQLAGSAKKCISFSVDRSGQARPGVETLCD